MRLFSSLGKRGSASDFSFGLKSSEVIRGTLALKKTRIVTGPTFFVSSISLLFSVSFKENPLCSRYFCEKMRGFIERKVILHWQFRFLRNFLVQKRFLWWLFLKVLIAFFRFVQCWKMIVGWWGSRIFDGGELWSITWGDFWWRVERAFLPSLKINLSIEKFQISRDFCDNFDLSWFCGNNRKFLMSRE